MKLTTWTTFAVVLLGPYTALGTVLTLEDALDRARRGAPAVLAARLRPDEARGRLAAASTLFRENPVLEGAAGPRLMHPGVTTDVDTSLTQPLELGGRRRARIAGAEAEVDHEMADADDTTRRILADVASTFLRTVAARERLRVLRAADQVAGDLLRVAERRHRAGDVAD